MTTLVLMQPYFMPYIGYFALMAHADRFVTFDTAQFIKGGWIQRNRTQKPGGGWQYVRVPLRRAPHHAAIREVQVAEDPKWRRKLVNQLQPYRRAPHYDAVLALVSRCLAPRDADIATFNLHGLREVAAYIGLDCPIEPLSSLDLDLTECTGPGDWGRVVCRETGADRYLNPVGGKALFDPRAFAADGVELTFLRAHDVPFPRGSTPHEPFLSILDVLMYRSPAEARALCDAVELTDATGAPWDRR